MPEKQKPVVQLPPIEHIGIVVRDVDRAIEHYTRIGLGAFHAFEIDARGFIYKGREVPHRLKLAFSSSSPKIELIQVLEGETPDTELLRVRGEGISHIGFQVNVEDFNRLLDELARADIKPVFHRLGPEMPIAFLDTDKIGGIMMQLTGVKKT